MRITGEAYINKGYDDSVRIPIEITEKEYGIFHYPDLYTDDERDAWNEKEIKIIDRIVKDTGVNIDDYELELPVIEEGEFILSLKKKRYELFTTRKEYRNRYVHTTTNDENEAFDFFRKNRGSVVYDRETDAILEWQIRSIK